MAKRNEKAVFKALLGCGDTSFIAVGLLLAYWLRFYLPYFPPPPQADLGTYVRFAVLLGFVGFASLFTAGMYRLQQPFFGIDDFFSIVKSVTFTHLIAAAVGFSVRGRIPGDPVETYSRIVLAVSWLLCIVLLTFWRLAFDLFVASLRRRGIGLTQVLIAGQDEFSESFHRLLLGNPELGYRPVAPLVMSVDGPLRETLKNEDIEEVMLASRSSDPREAMEWMGACQEARVRFSMVPTLFHLLTSQIQIREVAGVPIFALEERIFLRSSRVLKRSIDLFVAGCALLLLAPLMGFVALLIKLESKGPLIIRQVRIGKRGSSFTLFKFRSMREDAQSMQEEIAHLNEARGPLFKIRDDPRVTRTGRWIRKFSIDELPQLINIFRGDMSLVGPRPPVPSEVDQYEPWQQKRFEVLSGLTGMAQISGRSDLTFDETLELDFYYIENWSPLLDIKIMLKTIPKVILARGAY